MDSSKYCNESLSIKNEKMQLAVESCMDSKVTFVLKRPQMSDRKFDFDFRYYTPYHEGFLTKSGLYVFKTADKDSTPFNHVLTQIQAYATCKRMQQIIITYKT